LTTQQGATATQVGTIQTTVGQNTASIQDVSESVDGLYAQKYIKLDVNGKVAGWGGVNDGKESNFILNFDSFAIGSGGSTGYYPFIFRNTPFTDPVTGTVFPVSAYLKSAMMDYQSVKTSHIEDLAVKTAKIDNLAVKTANIDNLAVTAAKIGDAQVKTLKIDGEAVTAISNVVYANFQSGRAFEVNSEVGAQLKALMPDYSASAQGYLFGNPIGSFVVNPEGGGVQVDLTASMLYYDTRDAGSNFEKRVYVAVIAGTQVQVVAAVMDSKEAWHSNSFIQSYVINGLSLRWILKGVPNGTVVTLRFCKLITGGNEAMDNMRQFRGNNVLMTVTSVKR